MGGGCVGGVEGNGRVSRGVNMIKTVVSICEIFKNKLKILKASINKVGTLGDRKKKSCKYHWAQAPPTVHGGLAEHGAAYSAQGGWQSTGQLAEL